ncbi:MAG: hypothetical protein AB7G21_01180 [Dehalococcoidia bacterium]
MFPEWLTDRGAAVSFGVVAVVLMLATGPVSRALRVPSSVVDGQWWWGGGAFLVVARVAAVAVAAPSLVLDPMVLVRFTDDLWPVPGALAALGVMAWRARREAEVATAWAASVVGLAITLAAWDFACPLRGGCHGAPASGPFAFPMGGLTESRLATPFIEGIVVLVLLAATLRVLDRWDAATAGWALLVALAGTRLALMPLTAGGLEVVDAMLLAGGMLVGVVMAARGARSARRAASTGVAPG